METKLNVFITVSLVCNSFVYAGRPGPVKQIIVQNDWNFVENKGQLDDNQIRYYGHQGNIYLYCKPEKISFVLYKEEKESDQISEATGQQVSNIGVQNSEPLCWKQPFESQHSQLSTLRSPISATRTDLVLLNSNPNAHIIATDQQEYYENYYTTGDANHGITHIHTCKTVTYRSIYPNIDLVLQVREQGLEYSFIVHPGGKVSDIQIQWNGLQNMEIAKNGGIRHGISSGEDDNPQFMEIHESRPVCFQGKELVKSSFKKTGNRLSFKISDFDHKKTLVIDPKLTWGTYFGGNSEGYVTTDVNGNVYMTSLSVTPGIATSGAYQTTNYGIRDAYVAKFNSNGNLLWATYYGGTPTGSGNESGESVSTDLSGNVFIAGSTTSSGGIATAGAYQTSYGGSQDIYIAKFTGSGQLQWATYFGGSGQEQAPRISTDTKGNLFLAGTTESATGIATSGAHLTSLPGLQNGFLAEFDGNGAIQWSTYFGGSNYDQPTQIGVDGANNAYISGTTGSISGIATNGAYRTSFQGGGGYDGFLVKFGSDGTQIWGTYWGGSYPLLFGLAVERSGNVYVSGNDNGGLPVTSGAYQSSFITNDANASLAKFNKNGNLQWATYFGGSGANYANAAAVDNNGNVYISGQTTSLTDIATPGAYQYHLGGGSYDVYLADFDTLGNRKWATYYGGNDDENTYSITADASHNVYVAGITGSSNLIATSGSYQSSSRTSTVFLAKFSPDYNDAGVSSATVPKGKVCAGSYTAKVTAANYGIANITKIAIGLSVNRKTQITYSWTGILKPDSAINVNIGLINLTAGKDTIRIWTSNPNGVTDSTPQNDTLKIIDTVNVLPLANTGKPNAICPGGKDTIGAASVNGDVFSWNSNPVGFTSTTSSDVVMPSANTTYYLTETITATGCAKTDSVMVTINPLPAANTGPDDSVCDGHSVAIGAATVSGSTYSWTSVPTGFTSYIAKTNVSPTKTTVYILTETNSFGCKKTDSVNVKVKPSPDINWNYSYNDNTTVFYTLDSSLNNSAYQWTFGDGSSATGHRAEHVFAHDTNYDVILTVTNPNGCVGVSNITLDITEAGIETAGTSKFSLEVFPNPFGSSSTVQYTLNQSDYIKISLLDMAGKQMDIICNGMQLAGSHQFEIDAEKCRMKPGIYMLQMMTGNGMINRQLVKF